MKLDKTFIDRAGLSSLPEEDKNNLLIEVRKNLEENVGFRLMDMVEPEKLKEFEQISKDDDKSKAVKWLESNIPDYRKVVIEELGKIEADLKQNAQKILDSIN